MTADAAYDTTAFYEAACVRGARVVVPPAKTASVSRRRPRSGTRDPQVEACELAETLLLQCGQVLGILQPDEARLVHQRFVVWALLPDLVAADLVSGRH